jgi:hypothetical protein
MNRVLQTLLLIGASAILAAALPQRAAAQGEVKWMTAGSLQNWFSSMGCEIEVGRSSNADQQDGLQWPAWYNYQDCQAAKGLWIGARDYTDVNGTNWTEKVVHVGPRVRGTGEFVPVKFEMISKYTPTDITVDGAPADNSSKFVDNNAVNPNQKPDRMIINVVNTSIGITMTRKIMQFSNQYHDNYMIFDYTFTNTGNVNADSKIELPNQTVKDIYFYWQFRYSPVADVRYVIGNATSWGKNAMNDARGDGFKLPTTGQEDTDDAVNVPGYTAPHMRAQFVWHGKFPPFTQYDNIGGPIWVPYYDKSDTTGRLGAPQFVGHVTLHADKSPTDSTDDFAQPVTTSWEGSDEPLTSGNSEFNGSKMTEEYTSWMKRGHKTPRHSWATQPDGKFNEPTGDPALASPGGFSNCAGYGPYTLGPGQSVHIVVAEAAAGLSRDQCITIGRQFKAGQITAKVKNDLVLSGKDSLLQTFRRAIANYVSGYGAPASPPPPVTVATLSGDPIKISWDVENASDPNIKGFRIFRAAGRYDGQYTPIYTASASERSYNDVTAERGVAYFYYVVTIGNPALNNGAALTPTDTLFSNRAYSQTFLPTYLKLKRPPGQSMSDIRIVPNPFSLASDPTNLRFPDEPDKVAFYNIPGRCRIKIFTELGELVYEIEHTDGSGDAYWNSITSSRQVIVSGIYIVLFEDMDTGERTLRKLSIIR